MVLATGGCADSDPPPPRLASKPCAKVAESRLDDARVNGYGEKAQRDAFRYGYSECVRWEAKGYEPASP